MLLSNKSYEELEKASQEWAEWHKKVIILDEGRKATFSKLFLKYKLETKTVIEAEHKARTDEEYKKIIEQYSEAEMNLIKARYHYNNLDKYVSLKQSELKRDLALTGKQPV
jgi:nitrogenase subunit NifH